MFFDPTLGTVSQAIQLAIAPVFMLAGIGALLNVLAGRLSRVVDRTRALEVLHPNSTGSEHARQVWELRILDRRIGLINRGLVLSVASGVMICVVVALMFFGALIRYRMGTFVAVSFVAAMALLTASLLTFLIEVRLSLSALKVRAELLEREG